MKSYLTAICLSLALSLGTISAAWSADFQTGFAAYESGDYATALREWTPLATQGNALAQFHLGWMYEKGRGVTQDYKTALKWFTLAAEQGLAFAQYNLGVMYNNGKGVPQNYKTAVKWYYLAAKQGHDRAQNNLKQIKTRLVSKGVDRCLFDEIEKVTGPETKKIVEKYCRMKMMKKSVDWLLRYAD